MRLTIAYSKTKKRNLVLINNVTHQREILSGRPIRQPLKRLKGNTTAIFNKNMLESMSIQIFPTYCFLLYDIVNYQNQLVMFTSCWYPFSVWDNWPDTVIGLKFTSNRPLGTHSVRFQWKISTFCLTISCFFYLKFCLKNLQGAKIKPFSSVISIFFHLDFG